MPGVIFSPVLLAWVPLVFFWMLDAASVHGDERKHDPKDNGAVYEAGR